MPPTATDAPALPDGADDSVPPALADRVTAALAAAASRVSFLCDAAGVVLWVSPSVVPLLGLDASCFVGARLERGDLPGRDRLVLGGDGRPRRVDVHATDLTGDPAVRGVLVEWTVHGGPVDDGRDPVTGLLTAARVAEAVTGIARQGDPSVAVIRLRADRALSEEAMRQVGLRLGHALRAGDLGGRLADGDVVVVCPGAWTVASAAHVAQRLRSHVNGPVRGARGMVNVRLSAGVATGPASTFEVLVQRSYHELIRSGWRTRPADDVGEGAPDAPVAAGDSDDGDSGAAGAQPAGSSTNG